MFIIYKSALILHITCGVIALAFFWSSILVTKGSALHRKLGKGYSYAMFVIAFSGILMTSLVFFDPIAIRSPNEVLSPEVAERVALRARMFSVFLFTLSILIFTLVRHANRVLQTKSNREPLKRLSYLTPAALLGLTGLITATMGIYFNELLLLIFGCLSIALCANVFFYIYKKELKNREWIIAHLTSMIGSGIGIHTAFFIVGAREVLSEWLQGSLHILPWVLPGMVGTLLIITFRRKYRSQYRVS